VTTANPVVDTTASSDVEVTRTTSPLDAVEESTLVRMRVDVPTSADVKVVSEVLDVRELSSEESDDLPDEDSPGGVDVGPEPVDVIVVADVVGVVIVVGVPLFVLVVVRVAVVSLVVVVVSSSSEDEDVAAAEDEGVTPVPTWRLWKMPATKWSSMAGSCAATEATSAPTSIGSEKRILM